MRTHSARVYRLALHRITTNLFLDSARRRQRIRFEGLGQDAEGRLAGRAPSPAQTFGERHLDGDIQAALRDLPPDDRAAVVLCDIGHGRCAGRPPSSRPLTRCPATRRRASGSGCPRGFGRLASWVNPFL